MGYYSDLAHNLQRKNERLKKENEQLKQENKKMQRCGNCQDCFWNGAEETYCVSEARSNEGFLYIDDFQLKEGCKYWRLAETENL